jgi:hypothetical protein
MRTYCQGIITFRNKDLVQVFRGRTLKSWPRLLSGTTLDILSSMKNAAPKKAAPLVTLLSIHHAMKFSKKQYVFNPIALRDYQCPISKMCQCCTSVFGGRVRDPSPHEQE